MGWEGPGKLPGCPPFKAGMTSTLDQDAQSLKESSKIKKEISQS